ncbi:MAG: TolC family protein [Xanthomonadales bacterium]|nr:TolC family protein [Xanthomonadales bacterium]
MSDFKQLSKQIIAVDQHTEMQQYIAQVLGNNPDIQSLAATARAASYNVKITSAENRPRADLNLSGTRSKDTLKEVGNSVSVGVDFNWSLDIWGKLSDDAAAAQHLSDKALYDLQQLKRALVSQSARLWVEYRGYFYTENYLIHLNKIQTDVVGYYQDAYQEGVIPFSYYQGAFQVGLVPYEFLLDAENSQQRTQFRLQEIQLEKLKTLQLMNILRGQRPAAELVVSDDNISMNLLALPQEIPATALENRPDIQAAFSELHAFRRVESASYKALLPQINLTASAFKSGTTLEKALRGDLIWQLIGGLTQPLFNSGQLKAIAKQKSAEAEVAWWQYQNTVLKAMLEVEGAIANDKLLLWQRKQKQAELGNLVKKERSAEARFSDGDLSLSDYLLIKAERIETQMELNDIEVLYLKNRIVLMTALGLPMNINSGESRNEKS